MNRFFISLLSACLMLLATPAIPQAGAKEAKPVEEASPRNDIIARVGDQAITFNEVNTALNSSAIVGVSIPALGTPERDTVRITLLDRFVSANLLYMDARKQGLEQDPVYRREIQRFDNAILAGLYRQHELAGKVKVSEEEIQTYYEQNMVAGTELTPDLHAAIESKLRRQQAKAVMANAREHIRDGVEVKVHPGNITPAGDADRADSVALAEINSTALTWGAIGDRIVTAGKGAVIADPLAMEEDARRQALENEIDVYIMADKARAAGLFKDPVFRSRSDEFQKTYLINLHRDRLLAGMEPTEKDLKEFYEANRGSIMVPEVRKVQMVVLKTRQEADDIKARLDAGEITMYQAAKDHSIAANAKTDLGEVGWVYQGDTVPALDEVIFSLGPAEISDPVETPAGWHLVSIQDAQDAKYADFDDEKTRQLVRRKYLEQQLDDYVVNLRQNEFPVEVYEDVLVRLSQQEADMVKQLGEQARDPASVTQERLKELQKYIKPGG